MVLFKANYNPTTQDQFKLYISDTEIDPVAMFLVYKSKLDSRCDKLWQKPHQGTVNYIDETWYEGRVVGHDPLECFMKHLCKLAHLSRNDYTNQSIRATVISTLDKNGFKAHHITAISGHKNESTIKTYSVKCPDEKKCQMNRVLQTAIVPNKKVKTEIPATAPNPNTTQDLPQISVEDLNCAGVTIPDENKKINLPATFELMPFDEEDEALLVFL